MRRIRVVQRRLRRPAVAGRFLPGCFWRPGSLDDGDYPPGRTRERASPGAGGLRTRLWAGLVMGHAQPGPCWVTPMAWQPQGARPSRPSKRWRPAPAQPLPSPSRSIPLAEDPPYTARSLLLIGRYRDAGEVTRRVIDTVYAGGPGAQPAKYARTMLILGLAQARLGHADAASAVGRAALKCGTAWPTMVLAGRLDNLLAGTFPGSTPAVSYHTSYVDVAGRLHRPATGPGMTGGLPS